MNKIWDEIDERARVEGIAIAEHNRLRIIPKVFRKIRAAGYYCSGSFCCTENLWASHKLKEIGCKHKTSGNTCTSA